MNKQQTAVEWLVKMLYSPVGKGFIEGRRQIPHHIIEQAKAMEVEQIVKAHGNKYVEFDEVTGMYVGDIVTGEQHYNETYGKDSSRVVRRTIL